MRSKFLHIISVVFLVPIKCLKFLIFLREFIDEYPLFVIDLRKQNECVSVKVMLKYLFTSGLKLEDVQVARTAKTVYVITVLALINLICFLYHQ